MSAPTSKGTALITGASTGIGAVYADRLAKRGYNLILVARSQENLSEVAARLKSTGRRIETIAADLTKVPNLLQHDNVLCMVVEFDTRRVLEPVKGSLFGAIAETVPARQPAGRCGPTSRCRSRAAAREAMVSSSSNSMTSSTITSCVLGCFERKQKTRNEFLSLVGVNRG